MAFVQGYAVAAGWNAADGSLTLVSELLRAYTVPYLGTTLEPRSGLVNTFPIRSLTLNGAERGDGMIMNPNWFFGGMPIAAFRYWLTTFFSSGTVTSVPLTIVTARYDVSAIWVKANVHAQLPIQGVDYTYDSQNAISLTQRFGDYIQL